MKRLILGLFMMAGMAEAQLVPPFFAVQTDSTGGIVFPTNVTFGVLDAPSNGVGFIRRNQEWVELQDIAAPVSSVFNRTGDIVAEEGDYSTFFYTKGQADSLFATGTPVYVETDPVWSAVSNLYYLASNPSNFLTSFTETDPIFTSWLTAPVFTTSVNFSNNAATNVASIYFNTTGTSLATTGQLLWNDTRGNLTYGLPDADYVADVNPTLLKVRNDHNATIVKGTVLARSDQLGMARPNVVPAQPGDKPFAVAAMDILATGSRIGYAISSGYLPLDTSTFGTNCLFFTTNGALTATRPAYPVDAWRIGCVVIAGANGKILVNITPTKQWEELDGRYTATTNLGTMAFASTNNYYTTNQVNTLLDAKADTASLADLATGYTTTNAVSLGSVTTTGEALFGDVLISGQKIGFGVDTDIIQLEDRELFGGFGVPSLNWGVRFLYGSWQLETNFTAGGRIQGATIGIGTNTITTTASGIAISNTVVDLSLAEDVFVPLGRTAANTALPRAEATNLFVALVASNALSEIVYNSGSVYVTQAVNVLRFNVDDVGSGIVTTNAEDRIVFEPVFVKPPVPVTSLNSLTGAVTIAPGDGIAITTNANTLTLSGANAYLPAEINTNLTLDWAINLSDSPVQYFRHTGNVTNITITADDTNRVVYAEVILENLTGSTLDWDTTTNFLSWADGAAAPAWETNAVNYFMFRAYKGKVRGVFLGYDE
jgi:hypothetical protein